MYVVTINRMCYTTESLLKFLKKSVQLGARRRTDSQLQRWYFNFVTKEQFEEFWNFVNTVPPMEFA